MKCLLTSTNRAKNSARSKQEQWLLEIKGKMKGLVMYYKLCPLQLSSYFCIYPPVSKDMFITASVAPCLQLYPT